MSLLSYTDTILNTFAKSPEARDILLQRSVKEGTCNIFKGVGGIYIPRAYTGVGKQLNAQAARLAYTIQAGRPPAPNHVVKCKEGSAYCCNPEHMYEISRIEAGRLPCPNRGAPKSKQEAAPPVKENVDHSESSLIATLVSHYEQRLADKMLSKGQEEEYKSHIEKLTLELNTLRGYLTARDIEIKQLHTKLNEIKKALS